MRKLNKVVFKLRISGPIMESTATKIRQDLSRLRVYSPVALAVVINSTGGSAAQSNIIREEIQSYAARKKIKVHCFAEDIATSGAYLVLTAGSEVYSSGSSLLGWLGSGVNFFELKDLAESYGIKRRLWSTSPKALEVRFDPLSPLSEDSKAWAKEILNESTQELQKLVLSARGAKVNKEKAFTGDLFNGNEASEIGLVDSLGSCDEVMNKLYPETRVLDISKPRFGCSFFNFKG